VRIRLGSIEKSLLETADAAAAAAAREPAAASSEGAAPGASPPPAEDEAGAEAGADISKLECICFACSEPRALASIASIRYNVL